MKPRFRSDRAQPRAIDPEVLDRACQLRKENPDRNARRIIEMLQLSGEIAEGEVKRSTLSRHLKREGLSRRVLKQKEEDGAKLPYRRFEAEAPNHLWQSDVKYGPKLPHTEDEQRNIQTYLIGFLDDFSRKIIHAEFYYHQDLVSLTDCCKKALLKGGVPQAIYVDHVKIYLSPRFEAAVAQLGGKVITDKTYHLEGMNRQETQHYIGHHIQVAGGQSGIFTEAAVDRIYRDTQASPAGSTTAAGQHCWTPTPKTEGSSRRPTYSGCWLISPSMPSWLTED